MKLNYESTLGEKFQSSILQLQERTAEPSPARFYGAEWAELREIEKSVYLLYSPYSELS